MKNKTYIFVTLLLTAALLFGFGYITYYVDPLFHYHGPRANLQYPLYDERYMNYGIVKNFDYDSVLTGTSMTENFNTSQFDEYFETTSIKVPFSGASYHEIHNILEKAFDCNDHIRYVMYSLDPTMLIAEQDSLNYEDYPDYLYDENPFNDVYYLLNKDIYLTFTEYVFTFMRLGGITTTFDTYKNWAGQYEYNYNKMLEEHERFEASGEVYELTPDDEAMLKENLNANIVSLVTAHPDTQFYLFVPPYSLIYFDDLYRMGCIDQSIDAWEIEADILLQYDNVHLFAFFDQHDIINDLGNYKDKLHYSQAINNYIIDCMGTGQHQLTKENAASYFSEIRSYYNSFDYDGLFGAAE